jgi:glyoxylase-like metal-dependent hydrolase (beta-lactamase superfamily II)
MTAHLAALLLAAAPSPEYQALFAFDRVDVAPGVVAFVQRKATAAVVSGNTVVIVGDDAVLLVDTGHFPEATRRIIAEVKRLTPKPVRWVVNTHWHSDHIRGNRLVKEAWPGAEVIATEATRRSFENPFVVDELGQMEQQATDVRAALEKGVGRSGKPLTEAQRAYYAGALHELELYAPDLGSTKLSPPDLTFSDRLVLHLGGREAQVLFLGRGNTAGDALVWLPDAKVLLTGDLLVHPIPFAFGSFLSEWGPTLRRAGALGAATVVPGHGPVLHDRAYLDLVAEAADAVAARVKALAGDGLSLEEVRQRLDLSDVRTKFARGDEDLGRRFDGLFLAPAVGRAYREAKEGRLEDEK